MAGEGVMVLVVVPVIADSIFETNLTFPITTQYVLIHRRMHSVYSTYYTYIIYKYKLIRIWYVVAEVTT
jgi:hypothetical protein